MRKLIVSIFKNDHEFKFRIFKPLNELLNRMHYHSSGEFKLASNPVIKAINLPFLDEVFFNSPLCQICEYASIFGGVCSLLLNRRIPVNLMVKNSQIVSCSAHRNWIETIDSVDTENLWNDTDDFDIQALVGKDDSSSQDPNEDLPG